MVRGIGAPKNLWDSTVFSQTYSDLGLAYAALAERGLLRAKKGATGGRRGRGISRVWVCGVKRRTMQLWTRMDSIRLPRSVGSWQSVTRTSGRRSQKPEPTKKHFWYSALWDSPEHALLLAGRGPEVGLKKWRVGQYA